MKIRIFLLLVCLPLFARTQAIVKAEYFFDNDPGAGNATSLPLNSGNLINKTFEVALDGLDPGRHTLCLRVMGTDGRWSTQSRQIIMITTPAGSNVTSAEYYFDDDPGTGQGTALSFSPAGLIQETFEVAPGEPDPGKHTLCVRVKGSDGIWSTYFRQEIMITAAPETVNITSAEYFIDEDPGPGQGIPMMIEPGSLISSPRFEPALENISYGSHMLYVRVRDAKGHWSLNSKAPFKKVAAAFSFDVDGNNVFYNNLSDTVTTGFKWIFGDGKESVQVNPRHTFDAPGGFQTCLIAYRGATADTLCQEVGIRGIQSVSPAYGGSMGPALLTLTGYGFQEGSVVKLVRPGEEIIAQSNNFLDIYTMEAYLRFDKASQGIYDLIVSHPTKPADTLRNAFTVQAPAEPDIWADIIGPDRVLINRPTRYRIAYGTRGNTLAVGVPLFIGISPDRKAKLLTPLSEETISPEISEEIPESGFFMARDSLTGDSLLFAALILPVVTPGTTGYIELEITSGTMTPFDIDVKTGAPMYDVETLSDIGLRTVADCNFIPPCINCLLDFISFIPAAGCAIGVFNLGCAIGNGINGTGPSGGAGALNLVGSIASTALGCVPGVSTARLAIGLAANAAGAASTIGSMSGNNSCGPGGCNPSPGDKKEPETVGSLDPNIKEGPSGLTDQNYIAGDNIFHYTVYFENSTTATAPASEVMVTDQLDTAVLDMASVKFTGFGFGDSVYTLAKKKSFATDTDLRPAKNIILRVTGRLDASGLLTWRFTSFDPATMALTEDFSQGFLPPNNKAPEGEGYVSFSIRAKTGLPHLAAIENKAKIFFDLNKPIETPVWSNIIDIEGPESSVEPITTMLTDTSFVVEWRGSDNHSGLSTYNIYVAEDDKSFIPWLTSIPDDSAVFHGKTGHSYKFYSLAHDWAGNEEQKGARAEAEVVVSPLTGIAPAQENQAVKIFPNPSSGTVFLLFENKGWGQATISVYNAMGRMVKSRQTDSTGPVHLQLEVSGGVYLIVIENGRQRLVRKLVVYP